MSLMQAFRGSRLVTGRLDGGLCIEGFHYCCYRLISDVGVQLCMNLVCMDESEVGVQEFSM